jgi:hypothetical protein
MTDSLIKSFINSETGFVHKARASKGLEGRYRRVGDIQFILKLDRLMELSTDSERKVGLTHLIGKL